MGKETGIAWTDHTFNPWWGCVKVSQACRHCYAETFSKRVGQQVWGVDAPRRFFGPKHWQEPLNWDAAAKRAGVRRRVFCASMADVFEDRDDVRQARLDLFMTIEETPQLDWLLLTKRPENIRRLLPSWYRGKPWPNVWLGTTVETQEYAETRIPELLAVEAVVHFVSYEPALGPVDFREWLPIPTIGGVEMETWIDWIIAGGESGHHFRAAELEWFRSAQRQCAHAGVSFFFKQHSGLHPKSLGDVLDGRRFHEFPR